MAEWDALACYDATCDALEIALDQVHAAAVAEDKPALVAAVGMAARLMAEITELLKGTPPPQLQ